MAAISTLTANLELNSAQFRKEMDSAKARTKAFQQQAKSTAKSNGAMQNSFKGAAQGVASLNGPLSGVSGRLSAVSGLLSTNAAGWLGVGAAVAGTSLLLSASVAEYSRVEQSLLKTDALLKSTGFSAGRTGQQLDEQARAVARNTLANAQQVREAQQVLLTFRTVQGETFDKTIALSQDLAAVMGGTAKTAALQLGKALESPTVGMTALRRSGVSFSEAEKEVIKDLEKTGRLAEAQTLILAKLQQQIGGAGSGEAGGVAGAADSLAQSWSELLEEIGGTPAVTNTAKVSMGLLQQSLDKMRQRLSDDPRDQIKLVEQYIDETMRALANAPHDLALQQRLDDATKRWHVYNDQIKVLNQRAAQEEKAAQKAEAEAALAAQQDRGISTLRVLDKQYAGELDKLRANHQQQVDQIEVLVLSDEEIRKRGFDSIESLRADYLAKEDAAYGAQVKKFEEQEAAKLKAVSDRLQRQREKAFEDALGDEELYRRDQEKNEKLIDLAQARFDRLHQQALEADNRDVELEAIRYERELAKMEEGRIRLESRGLLDAEMKQKFRDAEVRAEEIHKHKLQQIENKRIQQVQQGYSLMLGIADRYNQARANGENKYQALALNVGRILLDEKKRNALKEALLHAKTAIVQAWTSAPFPANLPAVAITTAQTALEISGIKGIAHGGMDYVPSESTFLLDKGERVLSPKQNRDLTGYLQDQNRGGGAQVVNIHNYTGEAVEQRQNGNQLDVIIGRVKESITDDINRGTGVSIAMQNVFGVGRKGAI